VTERPDHPQSPATLMLARAASGDATAGSELLPLIYTELRALAARYLRREAPGHTLQPTALVHEAYLRLVTPADAGTSAGEQFTGRVHFMAAAALTMRNILVDHARRRSAAKRGGAHACRVSVGGPGGPDLATERRDLAVLELDDLLRHLGRLDPRRGRVVELKFFAGMTNDEVAAALGVSRWTVADDWTVAKAWIAAELAER
jgi:RNA polymerase sigma factor (TIGR02999 family)